jgi:hypothetical protein
MLSLEKGTIMAKRRKPSVADGDVIEMKITEKKRSST